MNLKVWQAYRELCSQMGVEMTFEGAREFAQKWRVK